MQMNKFVWNLHLWMLMGLPEVLALEGNRRSGLVFWGILKSHRRMSRGDYKEFSEKLDENKQSAGSPKPIEEGISMCQIWGGGKKAEGRNGTMGWAVWQSGGKVSVCSVGGLGSIPGSGRSPGGGQGHPLQCSYLENPMDRGGLQSMRSQRVGHIWVTNTTFFRKET